MKRNRTPTCRHVLSAVALAGACLTSCAQTGTPSAVNAIVIDLPDAAHVSLAIDGTNGVRVRTLCGDLPLPAGHHAVEWDGRDDSGKLLPAGAYRWVGLQRGEMHAVYRGSFQYGDPPWLYGKTGGWAADHCYVAAVAAVGDRVLLGSSEAEWGHGLIASDLDGRKEWGLRWLDKRAWAGADALATVGGRVYASSYLGENLVWEVDPVSGANTIVFDGKDLPREQLNTEAWGTYTNVPALRVVGGHDTNSGGELYVTDVFGKQPRTYVLAVTTAGARLTYARTLPVRPFGLAWLPDGRCVAAMDTSIDVLDTQTGACTPLVREGLSAPAAIAADKQGRIYVSDQGADGLHRFTRDGQLVGHYLRLGGAPSQQVKIFDSAGKLLRAMGAKGGQGIGKIDPDSFYRPGSLAVDSRGRLWVTEMTASPKRVSVWEIPADPSRSAPKLAHEFFGPTLYGGGAAMIDPQQPWRIMDTSYGVIFDVDLSTHAYRPVELPWRPYNSWKEHAFRPDLPFMGEPGIVFNLDGRRFAACRGGYGNGAETCWEPYHFNATGPVMIGEYRGACFAPLAAVGNIRMWMRARELNCRREEQWLPPVVLEAARRLPEWPAYAAQMKMDPQAADVPHVPHARGSAVWIAHPWPEAISGFLWTDANGDGRMQAEEIAFQALPDGDEVTLDSQLNVYLSTSGRLKGAYRLPREGFNAVGAPVYRWAHLAKITDAPISVSQVGDDGTLLAHAALYNADGTRRWSYPSSPKATRELGAAKQDVLTPGRIYRVNSLRGLVKGPGELGEVYMLGSVDGMTYFLTRQDGLFIATVFRPAAFAEGWDSIPEARPGMLLDDYSLQEECFNNSFARAEASGQGFEKDHYYMLGLGRSAVVELTGLESVKRFSGGSLPLVAGAGLYGRGESFDPAATAARLKVKAPPKEPLAAPHTLAGTETFRGKPATFASTTVWTAWDARGLHMKWSVLNDRSPFVNGEKDWTRLFSGGDACDIQLDSPRLGKCRFVVAMSDGQPVVVRLRYDGKETASAVTYRSGIAETRVPAVEKLAAPCQVRRGKQDYVLQVTLPWEALGIEPKAGLRIPFELGVLSSDAGGTRTAAREYWASGESGMVADLPTEARLTSNWGTLEIQ